MNFLTQPKLGLPVGHSLKLSLQHPGHRLGRTIQPLRIGYDLLARCNDDLPNHINRSLIGRVKGSDRIDVLIEQLNPVRHRRRHRIEVDDSAANTHLAAAFDALHPFIAHLDHPIQERIQLECSSVLKRNPGIRHDFRRRKQTAHTGKRRNDNTPEASGAADKDINPLC